ncbi:16S rRNA (adenine(1518)-N(6)/adenine(1519)-N(6))-dimethyltransferase, partial [Salmonella enterica subsp. enterica serovar Typhimurium]|nr:16S rRNA (adenine(1518)-N(6)/adenine(1519)-N(6))-dimethyltransferase [Salmonella enterica subsp. enterica serovar Typhimurium]
AEVRPAAAAGGPTALVANLPYNVAVPVLLHALAVLPGLRHGLVMVQEEVADRLAAGPGSKVYGVPSAKAAWYADVRKAGTIGT